MQLQNKYKRFAVCGMMTALAVIAGYVEMLIPVNFGVPGIKLGLANAVILIAMHSMGVKEACIISGVRILINGSLFGNVMYMLFSFAGAVFSMGIMLILKKAGGFGLTGISVSGAIAHNAGQILVAVFVVSFHQLFYYLPFLILAGTLSGIAIGLIAGEILKRTEGYIRRNI